MQSNDWKIREAALKEIDFRTDEMEKDEGITEPDFE
jgi:hypothetical protein